MKIITLNVNGLRAAIKKGFHEWLNAESPDILCLQEIKATTGDIDHEPFAKMGYQVILFPAIKKGYSGVAVFAKNEPTRVQKGIGHSLFDDEGRILQIEFGEYILINAYFPSGTAGNHRQEIKMDFLQVFRDYLIPLKNHGRKIIITGDFNICHTEIDIHHPERHHKMSGFLPEERAWLNEFFNEGFVDVFRFLNPDATKYTWWSYRMNAREKNLGWRIDYIVVSENLSGDLIQANIQHQISLSDHCPVAVNIKT